MPTDEGGTVAMAHIGAEGADVESVYVHATGFCKELWIPVVRRVDRLSGSPRSSALLVDQRGHGDSTPFHGPLLWDLVARDLIEALADVPHPIVGVGHSSGGAAVARAEILKPGTFSSMVLIEPIVLPPPFGHADIPLASIAERRRRRFPSRAAARQRFSHGPFSAWDDEVLDLYIDHAFRRDEDGLELKCAPETEAECYRQGSNVDTWNRLGEIDCPVAVVSGGTSDTLREPRLSALVGRFRDASSVVIDGLGHLAPMEAPDLVGDVISNELSVE